MQLRNNKILILGGSSGIGKAIAKRFCDAGATVMITGRSAELAFYLMSDYGEIICGHTVVADGGDKYATL